jgi:hypothetical protein
MGRDSSNGGRNGSRDRLDCHYLAFNEKNRGSAGGVPSDPTKEEPRYGRAGLRLTE